MSFYFCDKYINTDCEDKYVERAMFVRLSHFFEVLIIVMDLKLGKAILKKKISYFPCQLRKNAVMRDLSRMEKLIIGGEVTIDFVNIGLSCKTFVLGMLHPFIPLNQIAESLMLSKSLNLRAYQSLILSLQKFRQIQNLQSLLNLTFLMR